MTDRMHHLPCGQAVNSNLGPTHFENLPAIRLRPEKHGCACGDEFLCYGNPAPLRTCYELIYTSCLSGFPISSSEKPRRTLEKQRPEAADGLPSQ